MEPTSLYLCLLTGAAVMMLTILYHMSEGWCSQPQLKWAAIWGCSPMLVLAVACDSPFLRASLHWIGACLVITTSVLYCRWVKRVSPLTNPTVTPSRSQLRSAARFVVLGCGGLYVADEVKIRVGLERSQLLFELMAPEAYGRLITDPTFSEEEGGHACIPGDREAVRLLIRYAKVAELNDLPHEARLATEACAS